MDTQIKYHPRRRRLLYALGITAIICFVILGAFFFPLYKWLGIGAQGADWLRGLVGDKVVARLETVVFQAQDGVIRWAAASPHFVPHWGSVRTA